MKVWRLFFLTLFFVFFVLLLWHAVTVLLLFFAGALFAVALRFLSDFISRFTPLPPLGALTLVLVLLIGGGITALVFAAPSIAEQTQGLVSNLKESVSSMSKELRETTAGAQILDWIEGMGGEEMPNLWNRIAGVFATTFGAVTTFALTFLIAIFLAYNPTLYVDGFLRLIPIPRRNRAQAILCSIGDTLRWWMVGQLISMVVLSISTWLMLLILGVPLASILGLLTGLLTFVPYLGPIIALIPILLVAFVEGPTLMLTVLALYLVVQNLESYVLMPIVFQKTIHLPPVLTIISQILLGALFGLAGIILATPLMASGITLIKKVYVEDLLGDSMDKPATRR